MQLLAISPDLQLALGFAAIIFIGVIVRTVLRGRGVKKEEEQE